MKGITRKVGSVLDILYPKHGKRNVLCAQKGTIVRTGDGPKGPFVTIQKADGSYRTLSEDRMVVSLG